MLSTNYDPRALHERIAEVLRKHPQGMSTREIAEILGDSQYSCSAVVSKMSMYGKYKITRVGKTWRIDDSKSGPIGGLTT